MKTLKMKCVVVAVVVSLSVFLSKMIADDAPINPKPEKHYYGLIYNLKFAKHWSGESLIKLTDGEKDKLRAAEPVLKKLAASPTFKKIFWDAVEYEVPPEEAISWEDAEKLIRSGEVRSANQWHSKRLVMMTTGFRVYATTQDRIDQAHKIIREIDPKGIFISYGTE